MRKFRLSKLGSYGHQLISCNWCLKRHGISLLNFGISILLCALQRVSIAFFPSIWRQKINVLVMSKAILFWSTGVINVEMDIWNWPCSWEACLIFYLQNNKKIAKLRPKLQSEIRNRSPQKKMSSLKSETQSVVTVWPCYNRHFIDILSKYHYKPESPKQAENTSSEVWASMSCYIIEVDDAEVPWQRSNPNQRLLGIKAL